jgi:hypothetical protein
MMSTAKLTGYDAIRYAEAREVTLSKYADPTEDARDGLSPDEAREVAAEDPSLIWVDISATSQEPQPLTVTVNGVIVVVTHDGLDPDLYTSGIPGWSIIAAAPDGDTCHCYWWYATGSGGYVRDDVPFDNSNTGHTEFRDWLREKTGCDDDAARAAMAQIFAELPESVT